MRKDKKMTKFSVVVPIHNEEKFLPYSLPSIYRLKPDDVVLLFDRCSDNSLRVSKNIAKRFGKLNITRFISMNEPSDFRFRLAFLRDVGCRLAVYDAVLIANADMIIDPIIRLYIGAVDRYGLISFEFVDYPVNWRHLIKRLLARGLPFNWISGLRLIDRKLLKVEDLEELKGIESGEDTHLAEAIRVHADTLYVMSDTIHLRPREDKDTHLLKGKLYVRFNRGFLLALIFGLVTFRLNVIKGYIQEKYGT